MVESYPYSPGRQLDDSGLLSRFLPPIPNDLVSPWLANRIPAGSLIFDPFGASPNLVLQVARAGYKVLTCVNNPIARFLVSLDANPPSKDDYQSALSELARCRVGNERLEIHLSNLYQTQCHQCGNPVVAEAFIWEWDASSPQSKIYDCIHCGDSGEHPVVQSDIELSGNFPATSMHRMRIIERISPTEEKIRKNLADALSVYQPRALYGLVTLVNRLESLLLSSHHEPNAQIRQNCLIALVLFALDQGNNLWSHPSGRPRPKQLSSSPLFREKNLWSVLETAASLLPGNFESVDFSVYPELTQENTGICVYEGPLRNLCEEIDSHSLVELSDINAVITTIPRHNQAFWTLSALWAGWIWGRETLGEYKAVLLRRRYDWSWHCTALNNAFNSIEKILTQHTQMLGLIPEAESGFIQSTIVAADRTNFALKGISLRADKHFAQAHWEYPQQSGKQISAPVILEEQIQNNIVSEEFNYLDLRGEPAPYIILHANALFNIAKNDGISNERKVIAGDEYSRIQHMIEKSLSYNHGFIRQGGSEKSFENAVIWHQDINAPASMISDKIESKIRQLIIDQPGIKFYRLDELICESFPGLLTPDSGLIEMCVNSYSNKENLGRNGIQLRDQDKLSKRNLEIVSNCLALHDLGAKLGFETSEDNPVIWRNAVDVLYAFFVISSAEIGRIVFKNLYPTSKSIIVIPGARSNLLLYKIRKNFFLDQIIDKGWRFLKYRHLRHLLDSPTLNRENLDNELSLDPLTESPAQLRLL
jgi:hypothetical protein